MANDDEERDCRETLPPEPYNIHIAEVGIAAARNYITAFFPEGTQIFCLDDDVKDMLELSEGRLQPVKDLAGLIEEGFQTAKSYNVRLWGVYPVDNPYFMPQEATTNLTYLPGCSFGIINPGPILQRTLDDKEDFQRSPLHVSTRRRGAPTEPHHTQGQRMDHTGRFASPAHEGACLTSSESLRGRLPGTGQAARQGTRRRHPTLGLTSQQSVRTRSPSRLHTTETLKERRRERLNLAD